MTSVGTVEFIVPARYNGPVDSAHGGYLCVLLATLAVPERSTALSPC